LKETVLELPWVAPKLVPVIMIKSLTKPSDLERPIIDGVTTNERVLLMNPFTVTITLPFPAGKLPLRGTVMAVSLHEEGAKLTPPSVTELEPWVAPKPLPLIVRSVLPTGPLSGSIVVTVGTPMNEMPRFVSPKPRWIVPIAN
jgi:hypothetical protein